MRCMVTGGAGFIGGCLARRLAGEGHEVHVVDNLSTGRRENVPDGARLHVVDLNDPALGAAFEEAAPEIVFHLAAQVNVRRSVEDPAFDAMQNVLGTARVVECARAAGADKVVYASSGGACYGQPERLPANEDTPVRPLCPYGASKFAGEKYVELFGRLHGGRWTVLRFANVYGPGQDPHGEAGVVAIFADMMSRGERPRIFGDGSKTRDYVYVEDVVEANVLAMEKGDGQAYNVGTGLPTSDQEVFEAVRDAAGCDMKPTYEDFRTGEVMHIRLDVSRIARDLGWAPKTAFEEGVRRTVEAGRK